MLGLRRRGAREDAIDAARAEVRRRHERGRRLLDAAPADPAHPDPAGAEPPPADGLPELTRADLTPERLRAGILRDGCVLVRGLVDREPAEALARGIDRAFAERERVLEGGSAEPGWFEPFDPDGTAGEDEAAMRGWIRHGGGVLAADVPALVPELFGLFEGAGLPALVEAYLGEPPLITMEKTTLRKAMPTAPGAWHQDGHFMGEVRALNLWLSLSRCGDLAPGLDVVPRRLDGLVAAGEEGAALDYQVSDATAVDVARPKQVLRPVFEPGDALLFDELFLHQTAADPAMPNPRYAVESWFFGGSGFPRQYTPIAV